MPELPEVETVLYGLRPVMEGERFASVVQARKNLRFDFPTDFARRLEGRQIQNMRRRAKYILVELEGGETLVMHLGMSGRFVIDPNGSAAKPGQFYHQPGVNPVHTHVIFAMSGGAEIHYNDARRFGFMTLADTDTIETHKLFCKLGVEPLSDDLTPEFLAAKAHNKQVTVKSLLMDQRVIAGLGNIYVCEALYRAGISPLGAAHSLATKSGSPSVRAVRLVAEIRSVLEDAIEAGGSSLRDHRQADGTLGYFQHSFSVYGRAGEKCKTLDCKGIIRRIVQNGRSSFYCPHCQRGK